MKRNILVMFIVVLLVSFTQWGNAKSTSKEYIEVIPDRQVQAPMSAMDATAEQAKRDRYMRANSEKAGKEKRHLAVVGAEVLGNSTPNEVSITTEPNSTYWQSDSFGDLVWTGACYNSGNTWANFVEVEADFYYNSTYLGSDSTYIWGGTNVQLISSGLYTNALGYGDYGYFRLWTDIPHSGVNKIIYRFTYNTYSCTPANAGLSFNGPVYYTNYLGSIQYYGHIKNPSANWVTYYTVVSFAVYDPTGTDVLDVDWTYADGASYGSSNSAIYPGTSEPFDVWFLFAPYNTSSYRAGFEYDEDPYGGGLPEVYPPFGAFNTPVDGSLIRSSVPFTGWALDDSGVANVKIYLSWYGSQIYIGDALFVDGARPDIAAAYPQYPNNTRAGWGYMMLTNFLPNGGNGYYTISAVATDIYSKTTTLGTVTVYCDNVHAIKPFGAIDTPAPGGTASGSAYTNVGWALTPGYNSIPTNGSTINVYVNGVYKGHPTYNQYRSDIATLFPGYTNANGAGGSYKLNTTGYANGLHSIFWTATDNAGNADGIGSRYFNISNSSRSGSLSGLPLGQPVFKPTNCSLSQIAEMPENDFAPLRVKAGFDMDSLPMDVPLARKDSKHIVIKELDRVEIHLNDPGISSNAVTYDGYLVVGKRLMRLPVGSTLDAKTGVFSWIPGPGHLGKFPLVFVQVGPNGKMTKRTVLVEIVPKTNR